VSFARNTESQEAEELSRLRDEVAMLGRINHPNIVRCLGATQHDRHINIFIEWMAGGRGFSLEREERGEERKGWGCEVGGRGGRAGLGKWAELGGEVGGRGC